jgi:hypothetical protein
MNQISSVERRKLLLKGWKLVHPYRKTQDEIDLEWVNKINKVKQNNKIAILISSDELVEDFEDGSRLVQASGKAIAYLIDASYFAFKKFVEYEGKYADMPFSVAIDKPSNHFKFMEAQNG